MLAALSLAGCQSFIGGNGGLALSPSASPQIVAEVQKSDPRARIGAREHPRILAAYGGEYQDARTERLVARIVGALTAVSENPQQSYRITVLDSPSVNAFALPGGYLYVTRGLLALANDASEVAAVLAHEMGHVTANHGIERQRYEEAAGISQRVATEVLSNDIEGKQTLARNKLRLAAFSRRQELQADEIGVRMLAEAGYDPMAQARFLESMASYSRFLSLDPRTDQTLDFLSSHPSTPQRIALARQHARRAAETVGAGDRGRALFLNGIDGLLFGDRPDEGFVRERTFLHPMLGIRFEVPPGFQIDNTAQAVLATGGDELAIRVDGVEAGGNASLTDYIASGWVSGLLPETIRSTSVNGLDAATARARADRWDFDITVVRVGGQIYRILTAAPLGSDALTSTADTLRTSFRRLTSAEAASLKPLRIRVVEVGRNDSLATLAARMQGTQQKAALFRLINALPDGVEPQPGDRVKLITE